MIICAESSLWKNSPAETEHQEYIGGDIPDPLFVGRPPQDTDFPPQVGISLT